MADSSGCCVSVFSVMDLSPHKTKAGNQSTEWFVAFGEFTGCRVWLVLILFLVMDKTHGNYPGIDNFTVIL
jgi:hypothetical protein